MTEKPSKDPVLEAAVERAAAPYSELLPPDELEEFKSILREELAGHPVSALLIKQLAHRAPPDASGDMERSDGAADSDAKKDAKKGKAESGGSR